MKDLKNLPLNDLINHYFHNICLERAFNQHIKNNLLECNLEPLKEKLIEFNEWIEIIKKTYPENEIQNILSKYTELKIKFDEICEIKNKKTSSPKLFGINTYLTNKNQQKNIEEILILVSELENSLCEKRNYLTEYQEKKYETIAKYINIPNTSKSIQLSKLINKIINTEEYKFLEETVLTKFYENHPHKKINLEELLLVLRKLENENLKDEYEKNIEKLERMTVNFYGLYSVTINTFFNHKLFEILQLILEISKYQYVHKKYLDEEKTNLNNIMKEVENQPLQKNEKLIRNLKILKSSSLKFSNKNKISHIFSITNEFEENLMMLLKITKISTIKGNFELMYVAEKINPKIQIFQKRNEKIEKIAKIYDGSTENDLTDVYHLYLYLEIIELIGVEQFEIIHKKIYKNKKLNSNQLITLNHAIKKSPNNYIKIIETILKNKRKTVLVTGPRHDHNGAFGNIVNQAINLPIELFEVHTKYIMNPKQLSNTIKQIGKHKQIDVLLIGGHGEQHTIFLDEMDIRYVIDKKMLDKYFEDIDKYFSETAYSYLISCSTGKDKNNIAQTIANKFNINVTAPIIDASHEEINIIKNGQETNILITYNVDLETFKPQK
ncbi:hypothetical protein K9L67_05470 [Candidatus Woesearchaeota archaeon]|nr:hypothetical protein [Candidatus Woesearchaeota archaeon]MCF7901648.1 hypothetical protein [Candidatus Woesearchaeota archaeon]MCF8014045.1 hypothetical protein [Candidatus Woesearchaeota archaeon]